MKSQRITLAFALTGLLFALHARAGDPVKDEARLATVEKSASREQARAAQKEQIKSARVAGDLPQNEWQRNQNTSKRLDGTHHSRKAARQDSRAKVRQQARAGEIPRPNDEWMRQQNMPVKAAGTHETRQAERREARADLKAANRRGEIPKVTEAGLGVSR